jgi:hypothetical protein
LALNVFVLWKQFSPAVITTSPVQVYLRCSSTLTAIGNVLFYCMHISGFTIQSQTNKYRLFPKREFFFSMTTNDDQLYFVVAEFCTPVRHKERNEVFKIAFSE